MNLQRYIIIFVNMLIALLAIAFYTLLERKFLGYAQLRKGPNKVSIRGVPQPLADAIKLFIKEPLITFSRNSLAFIIAPIITLIIILIIWSIYPFPFPRLFFILGILLFLCLSSFNVYTTLAAGWASNSKYALLGAIRRVAQTISYEVRIALILLRALVVIHSFDLTIIINNQHTPLFILIPPLFFMWFITCLAETNRAPFDFVEGESELVSGFNIEYGGGGFALLFMAEYARIIFISILSVTLFLVTPLPKEINIVIFPVTIRTLRLLFLWARGALPRIRYDRLINLTWKTILPFSIAFLLLIFLIRLLIWYYAGNERIALM